MHDPLQVCMVHRVADSGHHLQPRPDTEIVLLCIQPELDAGNVFHGEKGQAASFRLHLAGFEDLRDAGMLEHSQNLGLELESLVQARRHQIGTDHFQRHGAAGMLLLREVDRAHAALADLLQDAVRPDLPGHQGGPCGLGILPLDADGLGEPLVHPFEHPLIESISPIFIMLQQLLHFTEQIVIARAGSLQEGHALAALELDRFEKDSLDAFVSLPVHD